VSQEQTDGIMAEPEDFYRDFLPRFIDAQRAFHDGDPEPNLALWSSEDPVTLFAARGLLESGTEPVTARSGSLCPRAPTSRSSTGRR
jgi:hypothetical protein